MILRVGSRLGCERSTLELLVVRAPGQDVDLRCDDEPMTEVAGRRSPVGDEGDREAVVRLGRRYVAPSAGVEVLCTKEGRGILTADGTPLGDSDGSGGVREPRRPVPGGGAGHRAVDGP